MEQNVAGLTVFERAWAWFELNKKPVAWGACLLVVGGLIAAYYLWSHAEAEIKAGEALSEALVAADRTDSADGLLKVAAEHPGTVAGARALLAAAGALFTQGRYAEAQAQFQKFNREHPDSPFRGEALLGVAACAEAQGKLEEAARAYREVVDRHAGETVVTPARFALARIYQSQNKLKEARELYDAILRDGNRASAYNSILNEAAVQAEELKLMSPAPAAAGPGGTTSFPMLSTPPPPAQTNAPGR
jgi:tetratricopeptide (TPR) repeat protein